ncbi:MAG: 3-phosphoserine/phosphohydroxythreonine transaminase [Planctomycetales bacterium]|nr:3-phosphoserine/phosphohydroxythreonine transaminase [Planctomycetales bacterium]
MATQIAHERVFNFSSGPAVLPVPVLERIREEMLCLPGAGASILEISHRSETFIGIQKQAEARLRRLIDVGDDYEVLFLQGGARLQFSMIPANLLRGRSQPAQYVLTGSWGKNALAEAKKEGPVEVLYDAKDSGYNHLPAASELSVAPNASYVHITSNETIQGVQFSSDFERDLDTQNAPLVCDASSDFLHRPYDINRYGLMYACAQKNAGPAGVTVVILKKELLERSAENLPGYLNYKNQAAAESMWNTPPTFAIYALGLVAEWLEETVGGLNKMHLLNQNKAQLLYDVLDEFPEFYQGHALRQNRSLMNVTFRFADAEAEKKFLAGAAEHGLDNLKGHRSVGGIRASIYNAMPREGVQALAQYMSDFASKHA